MLKGRIKKSEAITILMNANSLRLINLARLNKVKTRNNTTEFILVNANGRNKNR